MAGRAHGQSGSSADRAEEQQAPQRADSKAQGELRSSGRDRKMAKKDHGEERGSRDSPSEGLFQLSFTDEHTLRSPNTRDPPSDHMGEAEADADVEREWERRKSSSEHGEVIVSSDPWAAAVARGLHIDVMNMRDAVTGELQWEERSWGDRIFEEELTAHLPARILSLEAVSREIVFSSAKEVQRFRLVQKLILDGVAIEEWPFDFGFVIAGSCNSWQHTIESAATILAADQLSGRLVIETSFFSGAVFLCKSLVRIFYDA